VIFILLAVLLSIDNICSPSALMRDKHKKGFIVEALKFFSLWPLTLHETLLTGSMKMIEKKIKELIKDKFASTALLNQYDKYGRTPLTIAVKINNIEGNDLLQ
jgi:hypothetical protein